jgi:hypothetical protein
LLAEPIRRKTSPEKGKGRTLAWRGAVHRIENQEGQMVIEEPEIGHAYEDPGRARKQTEGTESGLQTAKKRAVSQGGSSRGRHPFMWRCLIASRSQTTARKSPMPLGRGKARRFQIAAANATTRTHVREWGLFSPSVQSRRRLTAVASCQRAEPFQPSSPRAGGRMEPSSRLHASFGRAAAPLLICLLDVCLDEDARACPLSANP